MPALTQLPDPLTSRILFAPSLAEYGAGAVDHQRARPFNYLGCISGRTALYSLPVLAEERKDALENQY